MAIGPERATKNGQRSDKNFAEEIRGNDVVLLIRFPLEEIVPNEFHFADAIEPRIVAGISQRAWIMINRDHLSRAEPPGGQREDATAGASVEHSPA